MRLKGVEGERRAAAERSAGSTQVRTKDQPQDTDAYDHSGVQGRLLPTRLRRDPPSNVKRVRLATPADAETIAAIAAEYDLRQNPEVAAHPEDGWLWQSATPEQVRRAMGTHKDFWLAEDQAGQVIGYQVICPPRYICRGLDNHRLFGPDAERAKQVLQSGRFLYASQLCIKKGAGKPGAARDMQRKVLVHYRWLPLVCHVGCFLAEEFDRWDRTGPFQPHTNNLASLRFHQKQGYRLVGYVSSDLHPTLYSGQFESEPGSEHTAALYVHFRDGAELRYSKEDYLDPVAAILANEMHPGDLDRQRQDLSSPWKAFRVDPYRIFKQTPQGLLPHMDLVEKLVLEGAAAELKDLRRRLA